MPGPHDSVLLGRLHLCAKPGCRKVTYYGRCPAHTTIEDEDRQRVLAEATIEVSLARGQYREARARLQRLKQEAGVR